jgi:hypothetical protein
MCYTLHGQRPQMPPRSLLCIFVKPPLAGTVKTRLVPAVTPEQAASLAAAFFADTLALAGSCAWARVVVACDGDPAPLGLDAGVEVWPQGGGDLGERMERVLRRALDKVPAAIAIGTDSPGLPRQRLEAARGLLEQHDAVVGPSEDGGYYLLGLRRCPEGLLRGLPWSEACTRRETVARLRAEGFRVAETEPWFDVDLPADLARLAELLREGQLSAPTSARLLSRWTHDESPWPGP